MTTCFVAWFGVLRVPYSLSTDPEVLYLHAKAFFDCDHKDVLGGVNIQTYLETLQVRSCMGGRRKIGLLCFDLR